LPAGGREGLADGAGDGVPDVLGFVFDPPVFGVVPFDLLLGGPEDGERGRVVGDGPAAGRPLVDGQDDGRGHGWASVGRGAAVARRARTWYHPADGCGTTSPELAPGFRPMSDPTRTHAAPPPDLTKTTDGGPPAADGPTVTGGDGPPVPVGPVVVPPGYEVLGELGRG